MNPIFSIVVTAFNCEKYIYETLNSIKNQSFNDYEVLIINDASTDNTKNIIIKSTINDERFMLIDNLENKGVVYSRNKGFKKAKGKYICILDGDDVWCENKLEKQYHHLTNNEKIDLSFTGYNIIDSESRLKKNTVKAKEETTTYLDMLKVNNICCSSVTVKAFILKENLMTDKYFHEDFELWCRLLKKEYIFKGINEALLKYRVHSKSKSSRKLSSSFERIKMLRHSEELGIFKIIKYMLIFTVSNIKKYSGV